MFKTSLITIPIAAPLSNFIVRHTESVVVLWRIKQSQDEGWLFPGVDTTRPHKQRNAAARVLLSGALLLCYGREPRLWTATLHCVITHTDPILVSLLYIWPSGYHISTNHAFSVFMYTGESQKCGNVFISFYPLNLRVPNLLILLRVKNALLGGSLQNYARL